MRNSIAQQEIIQVDSTNSSKSLRVLLVEDNREIALNICDSFEQAGHCVDYSETAEQAVSIIERCNFDLIIVDIMLPGIDGIELCRLIRSRQLSMVPVLMLTAREFIDDKIAAFDAGADDYLTKPFSTRELLARALVLSRRRQFSENAKLAVGDIILDANSNVLTREGKTIPLGRLGFRIAHELLKASPGVVLRDDLEHALWGDDRPDSDSLRTHISILRKALDKPFSEPSIITVHGAGWKIVDTAAGDKNAG